LIVINTLEFISNLPYSQYIKILDEDVNTVYEGEVNIIFKKLNYLALNNYDILDISSYLVKDKLTGLYIRLIKKENE